MFRSIRTRLVFSYLAVIILAMGLSGVLLLSFVQRYFLQAAEDSLIAQARITAQALIPQARVGGPEVDAATAPYNAVQQQAVSNLYVQTDNVGVPAAPQTDLSYLSHASLQLGSQLTTRIRLLNMAGTVLLDSWQEQPGTSLSEDALVVRAMQGDYASQRTDHGLAVALPMEVDGQTIGYVVVTQPLDDISAVLVDLRNRWILSTGIGALLAGAAALLLSLAITRPVRRLTAAAQAVAQGQFDQPIPAHSRDELGKLSRTFNEMVSRLQAARQMQTNFVANVSHELRTPLTSIKGTVETLRAGAVDDIEVRDSFLKTVEAETDRLIRLVNDLLILSRVDSAALNLRLERVNILELAQNMTRRFAPQAAAKRLRVRVEAGQGGLAAWADPDRTSQVLVNLLDNAVKYSQPGGVVTVSTETGPDGMVAVRVRDEGIGIAAADLPFIGQRFYRADKARSRAQGGSGLGLAIAGALVRAHGGRLWIDSQEGAGTTVSFTLPTP